MMLQAVSVSFDWTINLGQLLTIGGGIMAFIKVFVDTNNILRDHSREITELKESSENHEHAIRAHDRWLVRAGLDRREADRREKGGDSNE